MSLPKNLERIIGEFSNNRTDSARDIYKPIIKSIFKYIVETSEIDDEKKLFNEVISKDYIAKAGAYHITNNRKITGENSIKTILSAMGQFYDYLKEFFPNNQLSSLYNFQTLGDSMKVYIGKKLKKKKKFESIREDDCAKIMDYFRKLHKFTFKDRNIEVIFQLMIEYGFSPKIIRNILISDFNFDSNTIDVIGEKTRTRYTIDLKQEMSCKIKNILCERKDSQDFLFMSRIKGKYMALKSDYYYRAIDKIDVAMQFSENIAATNISIYGIMNLTRVNTNPIVLCDISGCSEKKIMELYSQVSVDSSSQYLNSQIRMALSKDSNT